MCTGADREAKRHEEERERGKQGTNGDHVKLFLHTRVLLRGGSRQGELSVGEGDMLGLNGEQQQKRAQKFSQSLHGQSKHR